MSEPQSPFAPVHTHGRPFPWFCPNCRRQEVRRATIPYQCERLYNGRPITVVLPALDVPRCENCGELVFTYDTEEQINRAYRQQTELAHNGRDNSGEKNAAEESKSASSQPS